MPSSADLAAPGPLVGSIYRIRLVIGYRRHVLRSRGNRFHGSGFFINAVINGAADKQGQEKGDPINQQKEKYRVHSAHA